MDILSKIDLFLDEAARKPTKDSFQKYKKYKERMKAEKEREIAKAAKIESMKDVTISIMEIVTQYVGGWGVPVSDVYIITGKMIDVCNFLKISPQKSAAFVAREYNKTQKANNERSIATREAGMSGPPTILAYALNKTNTPSGSPSKVYNKEGCEIRKYDGKNPF